MRVYYKALEMNRMLASIAPRVGQRDRDLMRQLRRAASSVVLNVAEGIGTQAGNRELRFQTALGSAKEVKACIEVASVWGYLDADADEIRDIVDHVVAMLFKLVAAKR